MDKKSDISPCEICSGKDDILILHQSIGPQKHTVYICEDCALMLGIERPASRIQAQSGDLFTAVLDPYGVDDKDSKICERCGCTYFELRHSGLVGCSNCYEVFKEEIAALLRRVSTKSSHKGRLPQPSYENKKSPH